MGGVRVIRRPLGSNRQMHGRVVTVGAKLLHPVHGASRCASQQNQFQPRPAPRCMRELTTLLWIPVVGRTLHAYIVGRLYGEQIST